MFKTPIFISGIGRSGTSAVIKAIAEHADVVSPERVGEAPFVGRFISFLREYEDSSPARDYHLKNYQLDGLERAEQFSRLLAMLQYGVDISRDEVAGKHWVAKVSLCEEDFDKACQIFGELRCIYVMRNGIEVVNSARSFSGFADLSFEQLCQRWVNNLAQCKYVGHRSNCAVVRHDELVVNPDMVFERVFAKLGLAQDSAPATFIGTNVFNSSFVKTAELEKTSTVFNDRLQCWKEWSAAEKDTFVSICGAAMCEYGFERPYADEGRTRPSAKKADSTSPRPVQIVGSERDEALALTEEQAHELASVKAAIGECMNERLLNYHANPSARFPYCFMENPKVASTTLLTELHRQELGSTDQPLANVHERRLSPLPKLSALGAKEQWRMLLSDEIFRFTFVRNPYSRLLSAYLSKIDKSLRPKAQILAALSGKAEDEIADLTHVVSFAEFVEVVCSLKPEAMNSHWKPQVMQTLYNAVDFHFIGQFERLNDDFSAVRKRLFGIEVGELPYSKNKTASSAKVESYYTPGLQAKVAQKFESDFAAFGYSDDLMRVLEPGEARVSKLQATG